MSHNDYMFRITPRDETPNETISAVIAKLLEYFPDTTPLGYCVEGGTASIQRHCHIVVRTSKKKATIINCLKNWFPQLKGNGHIGTQTLECLDIDSDWPYRSYAYLMKTDPRAYFQNIPQDVIEKAKVYDDNVKAELREKRNAAKTLGTRLGEAVDEWFRQIQLEAERNPRITLYPLGEEIQVESNDKNKKDLMSRILDIYITHGSGVSSSVIEAKFVQYACRHLYGFRDKYQSQLLSKFIHCERPFESSVNFLDPIPEKYTNGNKNFDKKIFS